MALSRAQRRNAVQVITGACLHGHRHGWDSSRTRQCARMALMTAKTEAGLRNIASANVPESQKHPHDLLDWTSDGLGHDHASMGMFQQQTGYKWTPANKGRAISSDEATMEQSTMDSEDGWGTPEELMDIPTQTRKFLHALGKRTWNGIPADQRIEVARSLGERCQLVQGSGFPDRYQHQYRWSGRFLTTNLRFRRIWRATQQAAPQ